MKRLTCILICCCILTCLPAMGQKVQTQADSPLHESVEKLEKTQEEISRQLNSLQNEINNLNCRESFRDEAAQQAQVTLNWAVIFLTIFITVVAIFISIIIAAGYFPTKKRLAEIDKDFKTKLDDFDEKVGKVMERISSGESKLSEQIKAYDEMLEKGEKAVLQAAKLTESTEREIDELMQKIPDISMIEKPSPAIQQELDELTQKLRKLESLGGQLSAEEYFQKGYNQYFAGLYDLALLSFEHAIERKRDYGNAWYAIGVVLGLQMERHVQALKALEKAIIIGTDFLGEAWNNKGVSLGKLGYPIEEQFNAYNNAIEYRKSGVEGWYNRAGLYSKQGKKDIALKDLKQAIDIDPSVKEKAKTDEDFDGIRNDEGFKRLVGE